MELNLDSCPPRARYLVGVSGGRDSVALLHELQRLGYRHLVVCHLNHQLRGRASAQDAAFVRRLAARSGLTLEAEAMDVAKRAADNKQSLETCARQARHEFFAAVARKYRCPRIFLAHHAEDQAETVLMRALRGSGLAGLSGMNTQTEVMVGRTKLLLLRPMLEVRRSEIDAYISSHRLGFREDASNAETTMTRNRIRHDLLPVLAQAAGREVTEPLLRLARLVRREDDLIRLITLGLIEEGHLIQEDGSLALRPAFKEAHTALQHRVLHTWLDLCGVPGLSQEIVEQAVNLITQLEPARINLPDGLQLCRKAGRLWIREQAKTDL